MASTTLFSSANSRLPRTNTVNDAGGTAFAFSAKHALAQIAATGCFNGTFYATGESQLDSLRTLIEQVDDNVFLAKLAVYAREKASMKDMPAALLVALSKRDTSLLHKVFDRVVDNGRVLRTVFQMVRSGQFGRTSLSSSLQRAFQRWLNVASVGKLLAAAIGNDPSLRDVLRLARPTPSDNARRALFGWLTGKEQEKWAPATATDLPEQVRLLEAFRKAESAQMQALIMGDLDVRWDLLADSAKGPLVWKGIARKMGPQALRMNLNTLLRHEVLSGHGDLVDYVAARIADEDEIRRSRQFPYQFLAAYLNVGAAVPHKIKAALHQAAEIACGNIPALPQPVVIGLDVSGSMSTAVTGDRGRGATSKMRCVDVAALFAAAILRRNPDSIVVPFDTSAYHVRIDSADSILSLAERLAQYGGGGTDCSLPLQEAATTYARRAFAGIVLVSDNESWVTDGQEFGSTASGSTRVMEQWQEFVRSQRQFGNHQPKLVCIDLQPNTSTQALEREDILNVGGFSDAVFGVVASFLAGESSRFVREVEAIEL
ncbi:MAG: TROVE domain-containing protein [Pirellulaceae bacterium]